MSEPAAIAAPAQLARCERCGTALDELRWSVQLRELLCLRCYLRGAAALDATSEKEKGC